MADLTEDKIRRRAFELWKEAGEPSGMMETFWYRAERELLQQRSDESAENRDSR
ncbi:DUF2934 domain-containing protein [Bradyrhizobium sp. JYMT SZCCT0428]|uniref:DUF2934 domain-containing protein n=1 Tax=Bradyrhizobium sp. JYMT SZCCT0428 TaxID=2807673 RepID=UPI001BAD2CCB|nr:DUF2934 domain-containing protein [Bradyrhizobium sp. JYMT SZCCT0428]MBR1153617.1 DUF2934 domain-containing protein [Bradyrhizobium sp. JYMT SZCCT0428]